MNNSDKSEHFRKINITPEMLKWAFEAEGIAFTVCSHFGIDTSSYSFNYIGGWSSGRDMKQLKSSLDTIRRTSSELITGIEGQLRELQKDRDLMQEQENESLLLVQNSDLSEYSLLSVKGMEATELVEALSAMNDDDKLSVAAYLESRGAWTTELGNEKSEDVEEYHIDVRYNLDTDEVIDLKAEKEADEKMADAEPEERAGLPDPAIGMAEMQDYGYTWDKMLPLTTEKALELFDNDLTVYLLHTDGSESLAEERTQIEAHDGIFGIEKNDWENERNYREMKQELAEGAAQKEAELLYGNTDRYGIYQLKDSPELRDFHFAGTTELLKRNLLSDDFREIQPGNYELVYTGELSGILGQAQGEKLNGLYEKFNTDHPEDFRGHSLSVSDILMLHEDGENSTHYVDSFGFTELPHFTRELEGVKEQAADKTEIPLTDEEKQFLETDSAPLIAKKFLAWDEIEDLGYRFFEDGYIDKFKPVEKALFGDGLVSDYTIHDIASRMQGGEDIRAELAKVLIGDYERAVGIGENDAVAVFGKEDVSVTLGNAGKHISYEEMGDAFLGLIENEYRDIVQARAAEEQKEPNLEDGDELIDLGDERERVLAQMKQSLKGEQETELAFQIADRYISIQETEGGYDYSIMGMDYKEIDGGVYDNPDITIRQALDEIVADLKEPAHRSALEGSIQADDELIPIDYDGLMEKAEQAEMAHLGERIKKEVPEAAESRAIADFKARTEELFNGINGQTQGDIELAVYAYLQSKIDEYGMDIELVDMAVSGSRCRGLEQENSDLDVAVEYRGGETEDSLFNTFNEDNLSIGGVKVDINPITEGKTGTLGQYLPGVEAYLEEKRAAMQEKSAGQAQEEKQTVITLTVAECGEFHNLGEYHDDIASVEEAVAVFNRIPPERLNGIPSIGINIHTEGTEAYEDTQMDIVSGRTADLEILDYVPDITDNPKAVAVIAELIDKMPDIEVRGSLEKWQAVSLAKEIDQLSYDYDTHQYNDTVEDREAQIANITEDIRNGNTEYLNDFLNAMISDSTREGITDIFGKGAELDDSEGVQTARRAKELLDRLAEYKPLAKIEELEECNYNMIDNVLNNEKPKEEKEKQTGRVSIREKLAEKKAVIEQRDKAETGVPEKGTEKKSEREI